jgi:hypothetical protein
MYKNDIALLQLAFERIFQISLDRSKAHFCSVTHRLVKQCQAMINKNPDGIVDEELWNFIMGRARNQVKSNVVKDGL